MYFVKICIKLSPLKSTKITDQKREKKKNIRDCINIWALAMMNIYNEPSTETLKYVLHNCLY